MVSTTTLASQGMSPLLVLVSIAAAVGSDEHRCFTVNTGGEASGKLKLFFSKKI